MIPTAVAKLSKLGSALLQQVPTGATSTVSTVENGKGTAAGLKLEVNSCSFEGCLKLSERCCNLRLSEHFDFLEEFFGTIFGGSLKDHQLKDLKTNDKQVVAFGRNGTPW